MPEIDGEAAGVTATDTAETTDRHPTSTDDTAKTSKANRATGTASQDIESTAKQSAKLEVDFPVWVDATSNGGTPMCEALRYAERVVSSWINSHQDCFPPIVINKDAASYDDETGLFAVSDGAGSASFSGLWAKTLTDHFCDEPLVNNDHFEVDYWVRKAREQFKDRLPDPELFH